MHCGGLRCCSIVFFGVVHYGDEVDRESHAINRLAERVTHEMVFEADGCADL